jgi:hypothetical protein
MFGIVLKTNHSDFSVFNCPSKTGGKPWIVWTAFSFCFIYYPAYKKNGMTSKIGHERAVFPRLVDVDLQQQKEWVTGQHHHQ